MMTYGCQDDVPRFVINVISAHCFSIHCILFYNIREIPCVIDIIYYSKYSKVCDKVNLIR